MTQRPSHSGFEPRTRDPERRDFFDLRRRLAKIEGDPNGNGSPFGDEVFIGPADPGAASGYELWVDTDAPPIVTGLIASTQNSGQVSCPVNTLTYLTSPLAVTLKTGRKYKLEFSFRALGRQDGLDTPVNTNFLLYDGATNLGGWGLDHWHQFRGQWSCASGFIYRDGDNVARSFRIAIGSAGAPGAALYIYPTWFGIEDVGAV